MEKPACYVKFKRVSRLSEVAHLEKLANIIFYEVYSKILKEEEITFLLNNFQNRSIIDHQIRTENYHYYLIYYNNVKVGYLGFQINASLLILSKLYILKSYRRKNIGKKAIDFISKKAIQKKVRQMELLVNEENLHAINFYENIGFKKIQSIINSFDDKIFLKDYLMSKKV